MQSSHRIRLAGTIYALGGLLWLVLTLALAVLFGGDPPSTSSAFIPSQAAYLVVQLLLLFGFFGVYWSGAVGRGVGGTIAFGLGLLGHLVFVAGEFHSLVSGDISDLVAIAAMVSAIGMLLTGITVLAVREWRGWQRWMPLVAGLYPWVFMFPLIFISGEPNSYAIAGWGVARLLLGLAIRTRTTATTPTTPFADGVLRQEHV